MLLVLMNPSLTAVALVAVKELTFVLARYVNETDPWPP
jgi:hypothetical protein